MLHHLQRTINHKLDQGWNPWSEKINSIKVYQPLFSALDMVLDLRKREIEKSSLPNYRGRFNQLKSWLSQRGKEKISCAEFTSEMAREFMMDLFMHSSISGTTYNNYLIDYKGFFNTLVQSKYFAENPFAGLSKKKEKQKAKRPWTQLEQSRYRDYCLDRDPDFWIVSMYCYYFALRPKEICMLRVHHVNFEHNYINVTPEISKNDRQRLIPIPNVFVDQLRAYLHNTPRDYYLCSHGHKPGRIRIAPTRLAEHFRSIANELNFDSEVKFYGLKDTCAEMLVRSGVHVKTIQTLFDHTSLKTTDAYMSRIHAPQLEQLTTQFPAFGG